MQGKVAAPRADVRAPLFPKLVARRNASRDAVAAHQRARLHAAMIEACARDGYASTTVRELIAIAGVSPNTIYKHFGGKEDCFLATFDLIVDRAVGRISSAYSAEPREGERDWTAGLGRAFDAFVDELLLRPKASRLALIEILAVGPRARGRIERAEAAFVQLIATSFARAPEPISLPPLIIRGLIAGIWFVTRQRLLEGGLTVGSPFGRELLDWMLGYATVRPDELRPAMSGRDRSLGKGSLERLPPDSRGRMLRAAAEVAVGRGLGALGEVAIYDRAEVSPAEFAAEFEGAEDCFFAAVQMLIAQAIARALRESRRERHRASSAAPAVHSLLRQLAEDAALARVVFIASDEADGGRRAALICGLADALVRRIPHECRPSVLTAEASIAAAWSIVHRYIGAGRAEQLPALGAHISHLVLAPSFSGGPSWATGDRSFYHLI
jgi:AcrR family transcriptional regulator